MRWLIAPLLALASLINIEALAQVASPEIWLNPPSANAWPQLFAADAPWPTAAKKVKVVTLEPGVLAHIPDSDILTIASFLKQHGIDISIDIQVVARIAGETCGGTEGYTAPMETTLVMQTLIRLGVEVKRIDLDEPVWFGHYDTDPGACQVSIPEVVTRSATILGEVLAAYPNVRIVEIEPIPGETDFADWRQSLNGFRVGLQRASGRLIEGMQVDVNWDNPGWQSAMFELREYLHQQNMTLGVFYNGTAQDLSEADWYNHALHNIEVTEGTLNLIPDQAVFASWNSFGLQNIPETSADTQTWLIDQYPRPRPLIEVQFVGAGARGRLTDGTGKPIANATIQAIVPGVDFTQPLPVKVVTSTVPPTAATAIIGVRLNTECLCNGLNDVLIGPIRYSEIAGGTAQQTFTVPPGPLVVDNLIIGNELVGGTEVTRVIAPPGQTYAPNSAIFPVTPGAGFQFSAAASTIGGEGWYGNIFIVWIDQNGNGLYRVYITPDPGHVTKATVTTNPDGRFAVPRLPRVGSGSVPVSVYFDGGGTYRSVTWTP